MKTMKNVKKRPNGNEGRTITSVHVYIDNDLLALFRAQRNKTRFINNAIRAYAGISSEN